MTSLNKGLDSDEKTFNLIMFNLTPNERKIVYAHYTKEINLAVIKGRIEELEMFKKLYLANINDGAGTPWVEMLADRISELEHIANKGEKK